MSSYTRQQLESWIKAKTVSGKVLDIGGSQMGLKGRIKILPDTDIKVLDLENPHQTKEKVDIICDINSDKVRSDCVDMIFESGFDYGVCLEVSEYFWNPVKALENINFFLKKGGTLFISFHFIYPVHNPIDEDCLRYTRPGVRKLLEKTGFKIKDIVSRTANNDPNLFYRAEGMKPAQGYDFHREVGVLIEAIKI